MLDSELPTVVPGVRLRPWRLADAPDVARHANDAGIASNLRDVFPHPYRLADAERYLHLVTDPAVTDLHLAIEVDGAAAGSISLLRQTDVSRHSAEIGYWLGRPHWGRGIATAAVQAISACGLAYLDLVRLYATVYAPNAASARVLAKAGYELEGLLRQAVTKNGQTLDALLYALLKPLP